MNLETLTIKDIAKICQVSTSTVSRAINNDPGINQKTKERILRVVEEFHFVPNNSARNLKIAESNTIALICKGVGNSFFQSMYPKFEKELKRHGYDFILNEVGDETDDAEAAVAIAKEKRLKGMIFLGGFLDNPRTKLKQVNVPYVLCTVAINMDAASPSCSSVSIDDERESYRIVDYLCKKGHKKIAIIAGRKNDYAVGALRLAGYKKALEDNGIEVDENLIRYMSEDLPDYTMESGYEVASEFMKEDPDCTAIFAISDLVAFGVYKAISEAGKSVPDDYSVVGFDGINMTKYMVPSLTTMAQPVDDFVSSSVRLLMKEIEENADPVHLVYSGKIVERDSVRTIGG